MAGRALLQDTIDVRCVLHVKVTTSNMIVIGECGQLPPSIYCHMNALSYFKRLQNLKQSTRATFETPKYPRRPRDQYTAQIVNTLELSALPPNRG